MRARTAAKKAENHVKGLNSTEEHFDPTNDQPDPEWWQEKYQGLGGYGDEAEWNWWNKRGKVVDLQKMLT